MNGNQIFAIISFIFACIVLVSLRKVIFASYSKSYQIFFYSFFAIAWFYGLAEVFELSLSSLHQAILEFFIAQGMGWLVGYEAYLGLKRGYITAHPNISKVNAPKRYYFSIFILIIISAMIIVQSFTITVCNVLILSGF